MLSLGIDTQFLAAYYSFGNRMAEEAVPKLKRIIKKYKMGKQGRSMLIGFGRNFQTWMNSDFLIQALHFSL